MSLPWTDRGLPILVIGLKDFENSRQSTFFLYEAYIIIVYGNQFVCKLHTAR